MNDALALALQRCLPKHLLTRLAGAFAQRACGRLSTAAIRAFIRHYHVDMTQAAQPDPAAYASFNDFFTRALRGLFARNERAVCVFDTAEGAMALVLVGATIVGSIRTVWAGTLNARRDGQIRKWRYDGEQALSLPQGAEIGSFALGSTVIALFERNAPFPADWQPNRPVRMGEAMLDAAKADFTQTSTAP